MRIFFATDVHGSEVCWRKFLGSGKHYKADVIILGGDMTGKALVPIIDDGGGKWHATLLDNRENLNGEEEVQAFETAVQRRGYYPFRTDPDELRELSADEPRWHALFEEHMLATVERWMQMADERLAGTGIRVFVCPGNDDQLEVDEVVAMVGESGSGKSAAAMAVVGLLPEYAEVRGSVRLGQPNAVGHLSRGGRGCPARADRADARERHGRTRAHDLQPALPTAQHGARRGAAAHGGHEPQGRRARDRAGRLDRGADGDRAVPARALAPRTHP